MSIQFKTLVVPNFKIKEEQIPSGQSKNRRGNPYKMDVYGDIQTKERQLRLEEEKKKQTEEAKNFKKKRLEEQQEEKKQNNIPKLHDILTSYYGEDVFNSDNFSMIVFNIQELTKKFISYQIDSEKQEWQSVIHQFRLEISFEAYKRYYESMKEAKYTKYNHYELEGHQIQNKQLHLSHLTTDEEKKEKLIAFLASAFVVQAQEERNNKFMNKAAGPA
ncbi:hypothetical protein [Halalkalibacter urbisdiaboli]|uniref:hypothetical protein n=1 Tax=Halalkalibacter urbisdiaboli TaxID=1960589 RepID=UPI000B42FEBC|nr:hypothetical protein [Halalkalibacter urbisdiaboli]